MDELIVRFQTTVTWCLEAYYMMQVPYSLLAMINALWKPRELGAWLPLFGSVTALYTPRNFWGLSLSSSTIVSYCRIQT